MPFVWLLPVILIAATAVVAALFAHPIDPLRQTADGGPAPQPTVLVSQTTEPSPAASPEATIFGTQTTAPSPTPTPFPSATAPSEALPAGQAGLAKEGPSISFVDLPGTLPAGEKTKITIKIDGPAGTKGNNAKITVKYHARSEKNGSSSSIKSDISNSFGSFTTPATFSMSLSLGQEPAPIELTASAEINGQTIETTKTIELKL